MRVIKVMEVSSDTNIGGAGKCVLTFLKTYDRSKFDVSVVLPPNSLLKPEVEKYNVPVFEVEGMADKSLDRTAVKNLKRLFREQKPDIVHTHASMSARFAARSLKIGIVYTRHSVFPPSPKISRGIGKKINGFINNRTSDRIIAVAEAAKDNLTATGVNEKKITVILNGVDRLSPLNTEERAAARAKFGLREGQKSAAIVARLNEVKGHKYLVQAAKLVLDSGIDAKFFVAGTGETEEEIRRQIQAEHLQDNVIMLGFMTDVRPLMDVMDVQLNCSFGTEATSLSLLEGMSLGKPAVVTDFGGNPGVIQDGVNGFLVPTRDAQAMADALIKLFRDDELYEKMREQALAIYQEKFTSEVNTRQIEAVYSEVYESRRKHG